jgi:hypothetical protein
VSGARRLSGMGHRGGATLDATVNVGKDDRRGETEKSSSGREAG